MLLLIGLNRTITIAKDAPLSSSLVRAELIRAAFIAASTKCKIAARVPLIAVKRLAKRNGFAQHDEEMINVLEEHKSESHEIIYEGKAI